MGDEHVRLAAFIDGLHVLRFGDARARLETARWAEREAEAIGSPALQLRARLVQAELVQNELVERGGDFAADTFQVIEINRWAIEHNDTELLAATHRLLSLTFSVVGDCDSALDHALRALNLLNRTAQPWTAGIFVLRLADVLASEGAFTAAVERYREAERLFVEAGDVERQLGVLNSLALCADQASDAELCAETATRMQNLAAGHGLALDPAELDTVARALIGRHEYARAERLLHDAVDALPRPPDVDHRTVAHLGLTLARVQRLQGHLDDAAESLEACRRRCAARELAQLGVEVLGERAALEAAQGRFEAAYQTYRRFHRETMALVAEQRRVAARTRQALLETTAARQEAQRFWRQARTDALTGLPNRRFVDEQLPLRLAELDAAGFIAAIIDADHFKNVNDTFSHDVGDEVLRRLATLLEGTLAAVAPPRCDPAPFVARLGGEEFLLVVPRVSAAAARAVLEEVRAAVEGYDWSPLVGDLAVTVTIGGTTAHPADTPADLLARADRQLYLGKAATRNQVAFEE